jgi:hypothetical protein
MWFLTAQFSTTSMWVCFNSHACSRKFFPRKIALTTRNAVHVISSQVTSALYVLNKLIQVKIHLMILKNKHNTE